MHTMCITHYQTNLSSNKIAVTKKSDLPSNGHTKIFGYLTSETGSKKDLTISIVESSMPSFKEYLYLNKRVESFATLDANSDSVGVQLLARNINKVAEQGFYYLPLTNRQDRVRCIICSGVISGWEENDDPQKEHKRIFPKCPAVVHGIFEFSFQAPEVPQTEEMMELECSTSSEQNTASGSKPQKSTFDQYPENQFREERTDCNPEDYEAYTMSIAIYPAIDREYDERTYPTEKRRDINKCFARYVMAANNDINIQVEKQINRLNIMKKNMKDSYFVSDYWSKNDTKKRCTELLKAYHIIQHSDTSDVLYLRHMEPLIECINNSNIPSNASRINQLNKKRLHQEDIIIVLNGYEQSEIKMKEAIENLKETENMLINACAKTQTSEQDLASKRRQEASIGLPYQERLRHFKEYTSRLKALEHESVRRELDAVGIKIEHLAESGFFPLIGDRNNGSNSYQCFSCSGKLYGFKQGDNVFIDHATNFPSCPIVQKIGSDLANKRRQEASIGVPYQERLRHFKEYTSRLKALEHESVRRELDAVGIKIEHLAESGFFPLIGDRNNGSNSYQCFSCSGKLYGFEQGDNVFIDHATNFPSCPIVQKIGSDLASKRRQEASIGVPYQERLRHFKEYTSRLKALEHESVRRELDAVGIKIEHLAESGFFPLIGDRNNGSNSYQCFSCSGKLYGFEQGDNVFIDHATNFPSCHIVQKIGSDHP